MLQGVFQRAAVAIVLMGALAAPAETCLQPAHKAMHACCAGMAESGASMQGNNCCAARPILPAIVVAPAVTVSAPLPGAQEFAGANERSTPGEFVALAVIPPQSPPTGAFTLRI